MIVDKNNGQVISGNKSSTSAPIVTVPEDSYEVPQQIPDGGIIDVLKAIIAILKEVRWEYGVENSPKIFKTVRLDDGQYERIIKKSGNTEYEVAFPAAFVHFVDTQYLVSQQRIGEGRAKLRIHFILNRLNVHDDEVEFDPYYVLQRIDQEITEHKVEYDCLAERCQLVYWDFPLSFDYGLQPGWLTYEIWFRETNIWVNRRKVKRHMILTPFTNHSDQTEEANENNHTNADHVRYFDDHTKFVDSVNVPITPEEENSGSGETNEG